MFTSTGYFQTHYGMFKSLGVVIGLTLLLTPRMGLSFSGSGSGASGDPYVITTAAQLQEMKDALAAYYVLGNDIDAAATSGWNTGAGFLPVGAFGNEFIGSLDGQGYTITGLFINRPTTTTVGLFGYAGSGAAAAAIHNVFLSQVDVTGNNNVGALIGWLNGSISSITNCSVASGFVSGNDHVGGLVGDLRGVLTDCSSAAVVSGVGNEIGGLAGYVNGWGDCIVSCRATGAVSGNRNVGGLVGYFQHGQMTDCSAAGNVTATESAGGLVGATNDGIGVRCFAAGNVNAVVNQAGGLVGICGEHDNVATYFADCYALGAVSGVAHVGGLFGQSLAAIYSSSSERCYSAGRVEGAISVGGLTGENHMDPRNSFWDVQTSEIDFSDGGTSKTTAQMMRKATFTDAGWDFTTVWNIIEDRTYPFLIDLSGPPNIVAQPTSMSFPDRPVNQGAASRPISLYNGGGGTITISSLTIEGDPAFSILSDTGETDLTTTTARLLYISFDPTTPGDFASTITIHSNDPDVPILEVGISGTGVNHTPLAGRAPSGSALDFNGADDYVTIDNSNFSAGPSYTIEAWFKADAFQTGDLFAATGPPPSGDDHGVLIELRNDGTVRYLHRFPLATSGGTSIFSSTHYQPGQWHHVAAVDAAGTMTLYLDGVVVGGAEDASYYGSPLFITLGRLGRSTANAQRYFDGQLDELRLWTIARSQAQIQADMNWEGNPDPNKEDFPIHWRFNENSGANAFPDLLPIPGALVGPPDWVAVSGAMGGTASFTASTDEDHDTTLTLEGRDNDGDALSVYITQLPVPGFGEIYQYSGSGPSGPIRGARIETVPTLITDPAMRLIFAPQNSNAPYSAFLHWKVNDGLMDSTNPTTYTISVATDDDPPTLITNTGIDVEKGAIKAILFTNLETTDPDTDVTQIRYTIITFPQHGTLKFMATPLEPPPGYDHFFQQDINGGWISYTHDGATPPLTDSFTFTVSDGVNPPIGPFTFTIHILPPSEIRDWMTRQ